MRIGERFDWVCAFVCVHVSVTLRTDQRRPRSLRSFQAASYYVFAWLEGRAWEEKNAQMYFENQHSLNSAHSRGTEIPTPERPIID